MAVTLPATGTGTATPSVKTRNAGTVSGDHSQVVERLAALVTLTMTGYDASNTSTEALAANANRVVLKIRNISDVDVLYRFGSAPVATGGSEVGEYLQPGEVHAWSDVVDTRALNVITKSGSGKRLLITEGVHA